MHQAARDLLDNTAELDYLTQIVIRMYEAKTVPFDSPERFRVEILFSPGANYNPFEASIEEDHVLQPVPRVHMEDAEKVGRGRSYWCGVGVSQAAPRAHGGRGEGGSAVSLSVPSVMGLGGSGFRV